MLHSAILAFGLLAQLNPALNPTGLNPGRASDAFTGGTLATGIEATGTKACTTPDANVYDGIGALTCPPTTDAAPGDMLVHSAHSFDEGSQIASELFLAGGIGPRFFTATAFGTSTGDTLDITVGSCSSGVCTTNTTTLTESTHWDCDVTSNNVCACALYTYLAANLPTGISSVSRSDGTCTDSKVFLTLGLGAYKISITTTDDGGGGVWGTVTNGADGSVVIPVGALLIPAGSGTVPALQVGFVGNGLSSFSGALLQFTVGGSLQVVLELNGMRSDEAGSWRLRAGAGAVGSPTYAGVSDAASGMWFPAAGTVELVGDGLGILRVTEAAGVGTTSFFGAAKGASTDHTDITETLTFASDPGDASKVSAGTLIPDGVDLSHLTARVITAGTNCSSISIGDGSDVDLWGATISVSDATTVTAADATASWSHPNLADQEVTVTANGGNCFGLVIAITPHFTTGIAATSD